MLFAQSIEDNNFSMFSLFLKSIINGDSSYKEHVDNIIRDVKKYLAKEIDVYKLNKDNYLIISFLSNKAKDVIEDIPNENFSKDDYKKILKSLDRRNMANS